MKETMFKNGQAVYFRLDTDNIPYMIISTTFTLDGGHYYTLSNGSYQTTAYESELSNSMFDCKELLNE